MKILITTDLFTTVTNGVATSVRNLVDELKNKGHDIRILTLSEHLRSYKDGVIYYMGSMPIGIYPNIRMPLSYRHPFIKELIDWKPDIIHSQCEFFSFQYALRISKLTHAPIVHTYHTLYEHYVNYVIPCKSLGRYIVRVLSKKRLKKVNTIIVPTCKVEQTLLNYRIENKIIVVPSGIAIEQYQRRITPMQRVEKRQTLGISQDQTVLVNLGRLGKEKNLEELLTFFASMSDKYKSVVLMLVGDGPIKEKLRRRTVELGITERVIFVGAVEPKEVQVYYQLGDVFVSASTSETQGLTYIEAAASGLPLLCRKDLCLKDIIIQGKNGYEYACEKEFMNAIQKVISDADWRAAAGEFSAEIATAFDKKAFGNAIEKIYKSIIH